MSHVRKPLLIATALNTGLFVIEGVAGLRGQSLSLIADGAHNFSDELALACLALAYILPIGMSRNLQRSANLLNSFGLLLVSVVIAWQGIERILNPVPVNGTLPIVVGLVAAAGNWGVAWQLKTVGHMSAAIRLAYLHNMGDVYVSLTPVVAGVVVAFTGWALVDALGGIGLAGWIAWGTIQEVRASSEQLLWPEDAVCKHDEDELLVVAHPA